MDDYFSDDMIDRMVDDILQAMPRPASERPRPEAPDDADEWPIEGAGTLGRTTDEAVYDRGFLAGITTAAEDLRRSELELHRLRRGYEALRAVSAGAALVWLGMLGLMYYWAVAQ